MITLCEKEIKHRNMCEKPKEQEGKGREIWVYVNWYLGQGREFRVTEVGVLLGSFGGIL